MKTRSLITASFLAYLSSVGRSDIAQSATMDTAATVGWWQEGSNPPITVEQLGGSILEMIVRRGGNTDIGFTVNWETMDTGTATPGSDFRVSGGTLTFPAGESEKVVQIPILDDGLLEYPETIGLRLFNASDGAAITNPTTSAVILDNEIPPTLDFPAPNPFSPPPPLPFNLTAVLPDGGILELDLDQSGRLLRFAADGTLTSISRPISVRMDAIPEHAFLGTPDNKAILSGEFTEVNGVPQPRIVRLLLNGTVDESFRPLRDLITSDFRVLTVQRDGRTLLQLGFSRIIRLLENGSLDPGFVSTDLGNYVATALELASGAILVQMGPLNWLRLLSNGAVDPSFQPAIDECKECDSFAMPDGSVIVTDFTTDGPLRFRKMTPDGSLDKNFRVPSWIGSLGPALPDGRLFASGAYAGGQSKTFFLILRADGSIDESHPGFVLGGNGDECGQQIAALSESVGIAYGCVAGTRIPLRGPFTNSIYSSSILVERPNPDELPNPDTQVVLEFFRTGETTSSASVRYRTRDGTAKAGQRYVAASGDLTFAPLESRKTVEIDLLTRSEFTETFEVVLEDAIGAEVAGSPVTVSILGTKPRFGPNPIQLLLNGSALITVLERDPTVFSGEIEQHWALESSEDLKGWSVVTDALTRVDFPRRLTLDLDALMQPKRFYRLRKL